MLNQKQYALFKNLLPIIPPLDEIIAGVIYKSELKEKITPYIEGYHQYVDTFTRAGLSGKYAIQKPGSRWVSRNLKPSHLNFIDHLAQLYWIALCSPWYVSASNIDADNISDIHELYEAVEEIMGFTASQYLVMTSPSYDNSASDHNGIHILFKSRFHDLPPTASLFQNVLGSRIRNAGWELYPNGEAKFRLPFGLRQRPINKDGTIRDITWLECLEAFQRLIPVDLSHARYFQQENQFELFSDRQLPAFQSPQGKAADLWHGGLIYPNSRYEAMGILARDCYFRNIHKTLAAASIKRWIKYKHNGFSEAVNKGNLQRINRDIEDWIDGTYKHFSKVKTLPHSTHNGEGWLTYADIDFIINVFPGSYINQKRLSKLILYYRPRQFNGGLVSIHSDRWRACVSASNEQAFKSDLVSRGLLEIRPSYLPGMYSRKYKLNGLPSASREDMIKNGERAVHDYKKALKIKFGSVRNVIEASGISKRSLYKEN